MDMCVGAKMCSGKATTEEEAKEICINQPPKEPKAPKSRKLPSLDPAKLARCIAGSIEIKDLTAENAPARLETAITHCSMPKSASPPGYNSFMKTCIKATGGSLKTYQRDMKTCQDQWGKTHGG